MTIDHVYEIVITAVLAVLATQVYVNSVRSMYFKIITELIKINEVDGFDPVLLLKNLEPFMKRMNVKDFSYYVHYLNTEYNRPMQKNGVIIRKFVYTSDFTLFFGIIPSRMGLGSGYMAKMLCEVVFLMLKSDVSIQTKSAEKAFRKSMELQTFINHDVKNLIQFVNMLEYNLNSVETEEERAKLIQYLKKSLPGLKIRADKVMSALNSTCPENKSEPELLNPYSLACSIANSFGVEVHTSSGEIEITTWKRPLTIIFENIIKNFYDKSLREKDIELWLDVDGKNIVLRDTGSPISDCEKIFEPFYSDKVNGLGIGLFHSRNSAQSMNATLTAENTDKGPAFIISFK